VKERYRKTAEVCSD